ncbi:hypothetical protein RJ641_027166 [Dillenia turbinata]|uniref:Uncharacterized protein n=1 Tax=Dillenia turbinata TaxID=194707 RepID=A0AAN8ZHX3_9MAGN
MSSRTHEFPASKTQEELPFHCTKGQPAKMVGKSSGSVSSKHKTGFPYEKNSNIFKFKSTRTSGGGENRVATKQKVLFPKSASEQAKTRKCSEKLADAGERDTSLDASRQAVGSDRDKLRDISGETTQVGADMISSSRKSETLKSSSRPAKDQTDASEAIKPAIIENWKPSAVRKTTGQTNVKPNPFKGLRDARKEMIVYPNSYDTKPDLCKGSTDAPKRKIISSSCKKDKSLDLWKREKPSCSCKKRENKRTNLILVAKSQNTVHTRMKNRELNFEAEEKDHKEKNPGGQQVKENEEEKIDDIQNAEISAADDLNLISLLKQERKKAKRRTLSDPAVVQQPCIPSKDDPILPLVPISKRPRKTSIAGSNSLALALSCTTVKKSVKSGVYAANNLRLAPAICISPDIVSEPHDQVKKNAESILLEIKESSILEIKLSSVCGDAAKQRVDEHLQIVSSCQTEGRVTGSLSSIIAELRLLTVVDLKAIAKQHDLKGKTRFSQNPNRISGPRKP